MAFRFVFESPFPAMEVKGNGKHGVCILDTYVTEVCLVSKSRTLELVGFTKWVSQSKALTLHSSVDVGAS